MEERKLRINIPEGYEIDKEKSTFEEIVFKKVNPLSDLPKTWEEYYNCTRCKDVSHFWSESLKSYAKGTFTGYYNEFSTKERLQQFIALGKLLQLRDYWVGDCSKFNYVLLSTKAGLISTVCWSGDISSPITFPTREMADDFKKCFSDLIKEAYPLI